MNFPELDLPQTWTTAQLPTWTPWAAAALGTAVALAVLYRNARRMRRLDAAQTSGRAGEVRKTVAAAGPLAVLGACGMVLSLYGLYGFATQNMQLSPLFALPIMAIFDLAEVTCFVSLYRSATIEQAWTRPMRRTRRMAWGLVAASAAMNAAHAPGNAMAMIVFAAVPAISAKLIEFELDKQMAANGEAETDDGGPGLVRLVQLVYTHAWAIVFARLGFDATSKDGLIHQDARLRRAARQIHELRRALTEQDEVSGTGRPRKVTRARERVESRQAKAELAIDVAGIAGDTPAQLTLARNLVTRGRVVDLARMDVRDPMGIVTTLEELAIVPSAEAIQAGARAAQAEKQREEAERATRAAQQAQEAAEAEAVKVQAEAAAVLASAHAARKQAEADASALEDKASTAAKEMAEAQAARDSAEADRQQLTAEVARLSNQASELRTSASTTASERQALAEQLAELQDAAQKAARQVEECQRQAEEARNQAQQALASRRTAAEKAKETTAQVLRLQEQAKELEEQARRHAEQRRAHTAVIERLTNEQAQAEAATREARNKADRASREAQEAEAARHLADVAMRHARTEMLDALTSPDAYEPPRWTSTAKMRGWTLYLHTVRTQGTEPTDSELAGTDRDTSTARKWLIDFRAELAKITAAALPAQQTAHDRAADEAPALV